MQLQQPAAQPWFPRPAATMTPSAMPPAPSMTLGSSQEGAGAREEGPTAAYRISFLSIEPRPTGPDGAWFSF